MSALLIFDLPFNPMIYLIELIKKEEEIIYFTFATHATFAVELAPIRTLSSIFLIRLFASIIILTKTMSSLINFVLLSL